MTFILAGGKRREVGAEAGMTVLQIAWANDIGIEGACEGEMACATCHVIVDAEFYARLGPPGEDEADMLDMAWDLTPTSRLGCQVVLTDALDGLVVRLPGAVRNMLEA